MKGSDHMHKNREKYKTPLVYFGTSILCVIIYNIYNHFSHGVTSPYMTFLFVWPLALGFLPFLLLSVIPNAVFPGRIAYNIYNSGVAAVTVSSLLRGVFDIAGTASVYQTVLMVIGASLLFGGILIYMLPWMLLGRIREHNQ